MLPCFASFPCNPPRILHGRIERLCRIIVHDPSMGSLRDMDSCVKPASSGSKISRPWSYFHFSNSAYVSTYQSIIFFLAEASRARTVEGGRSNRSPSSVALYPSK